MAYESTYENQPITEFIELVKTSGGGSFEGFLGTPSRDDSVLTLTVSPLHEVTDPFLTSVEQAIQKSSKHLEINNNIPFDEPVNSIDSLMTYFRPKAKSKD